MVDDEAGGAVVDDEAGGAVVDDEVGGSVVELDDEVDGGVQGVVVELGSGSGLPVQDEVDDVACWVELVALEVPGPAGCEVAPVVVLVVVVVVVVLVAGRAAPDGVLPLPVVPTRSAAAGR